MSGHSHWSSIKHQKGAADAKKSKVFSKMAREITVAAREGGSNLTNNPKLKLIIEKAKSFNLPKENIERAIKKGTGELKGDFLENITLEAYGPEGIAIIVEGITDNKNRALSEIKQILTKYNGKLVGEGAIKWMFERKGCITISLKSQIQNPKNKEELELLIIEAGAEDIYWHNDILDVYTKPEELEKLKRRLEEMGVKIESDSLGWTAKEQICLDEKKGNACQKLFEALDENEAVQEIYSNLKI